MKPIVKKLISTNTLLILIYLLLQLFFLTRIPDVMEDEPWYANTAYNFVSGNGFINTNVGHYGGDFFVVYTFLLSIGIKIFGCTLLASRIISVVAGLISLGGILSILKSLKISKFISVLATLMFIFSNVTYVIFRSGRPEGWILAFGIWSFYYLIRYHESKQIKHALYVSLFASLSFLIHPNGMLFLLNAGIYFLVQSIRERKFKPLIYYGSGAVIIIVLYFAFAFSMPRFSLKEFLVQVTARNSISGQREGFMYSFVHFFNTYTLGIKRLYILVFEIGILLAGILFSKRNIMLRYFAFFGILNLILSLLLFSKYSNRHFGEIIIFSVIAFAILANTIQNKKSYLAIVAVGLIYFLNNLAGDGYIIYKKYHNTPYSSIEKQLTMLIPENSTVLTSLHFWYPLRNTQFYSEYVYWEAKPYTDLNDLLQSNTVDYVIYTDAFIKGETGTSGRKENVPEDDIIYFQDIFRFAKENGEIISSLNTTGFGTINVYKINAIKP